MNEERYIKGFNAGYLMQEKDPDLFKSLSENLTMKNEFLEGMKDGGEQYVHDQVDQLKDQHKDDLDPDKMLLDNIPSKEKDRSKDLEK